MAKIKKCIFMGLTGNNYDQIRDPTYITPGWDYICFTNNKKLKSKTWDIRLIDDCGLDNIRLSRRVWILYHKYVNDYDLSISTGAQMQATCNLDDFVHKFLSPDDDVDMTMASHPNRICIYAEAKRCFKRDNPKTVRRQIDFYRSEGYPKDNGLVATGVMIRKHHRQNLEEHCEKWWDQVCKYSYRDQLSFNYILWKYNLIKASYFSYLIIRGKDNYFKKHRHVSETK